MNSHLSIPMFASRVPAGFPSPAQDYVEESLDLNQLCIQHPTATYFVRASGESMLDAGIHNSDVLVVDRSITAKHGDIVVASLDHSFTVKRLETSPKLRLMPMNEDSDEYHPLEIDDGIEFEIFGVVSFVVHALR